MFRIIVCISLVCIILSQAERQKDPLNFKSFGSECTATDTCKPQGAIEGGSVDDSKGPSLRCEAKGTGGFGRTRCCIQKTSVDHCILARGDTKGTCECLHRDAKLEIPKEDTTTTRPTTTTKRPTTKTGRLNKAQRRYALIGRGQCTATDTCMPQRRTGGGQVDDDKGPSLRCEAKGVRGFGRTRCCIQKTSVDHCILARGDAKGTCECLNKDANLEYAKEGTT